LDTNILEEQAAVIFFSRPQGLHYEWAGLQGRAMGESKVMSRPMA